MKALALSAFSRKNVPSANESTFDTAFSLIHITDQWPKTIPETMKALLYKTKKGTNLTTDSFLLF